MFSLSQPSSLDWAKQLNTGKGLDLQVRATDADNSDRSIGDTLGMMAGFANKAKWSEQVTKALREAGVSKGLDEDQVIQRVFSFIKKKVKFTEDEDQLAKIFDQPNSKELLITPPALLSMKQPMGDCDDFSMLACAMLIRSNVQCDFKTVAADERYPDQFTHVYCVVTKKNGERIPFDASHGKMVGWETEKQWRRFEWPVLDWDKLKGEGMRGLGQDDSPTYLGVDPSTIDYTYLIPDLPTNIGTPPINWNNILPGVFAASEKIALQTTQQPGYQMTGPGGQSVSVVSPKGSVPTNLNFGTGSSGSMMIWVFLALGVGALLLIKKS